ncbi:hypothetical protein S141_17 [Shewanella sp. phage 1/41]|uniref:hypothetical protein n=1 Tax=Shewanella sp. phage 1/41 TaxID=1458861 RepID=UPI0004F632DE|nr:hypothetical protein S141_17 [Shewanella sp. phage 1/41]AHK11663.1 hypothetical protein S141_17 [Shewanella sp. phage 1/41]
MTGCQSSTEIRYIEVPVCAGLEPISPSVDDVLTDGTVDQILSLNCKILACKGVEHPACE